LKQNTYLKEAIDNRVIFEKQGAYNWVRPAGAIVLGETQGEAVDFLMNPKKSALVEELAQAIKLKNL